MKRTIKAFVLFAVIYVAFDVHFTFAQTNFPKLDIGAFPIGASTNTGQINSSGTTAGYYFYRRNATTASAITGVPGDGYAWYSSDGNAAALWTYGTGDLITFKKNGLVGIGTATPYDKLHVNGDISIQVVGCRGCY
jgi:hypothetical protein